MRFIHAAILIFALSGCKKQEEPVQSTAVPAKTAGAKTTGTVKAKIRSAKVSKTGTKTEKTETVDLPVPIPISGVAVWERENKGRVIVSHVKPEAQLANENKGILALGFEQPDPDSVLIELLTGLIQMSEVSFIDLQHFLAPLDLAIIEMRAFTESFVVWQQVDIEFEDRFWPMLESEWKIGTLETLETLKTNFDQVIEKMEWRFRQALQPVLSIRLNMIDRLEELIEAASEGLTESALMELVANSVSMVTEELGNARDTARELRFVRALISQVGVEPGYFPMFNDLEISGECMSDYWTYVNHHKVGALQLADSLDSTDQAYDARNALRQEVSVDFQFDGVCDNFMTEERKDFAIERAEKCFDSVMYKVGICVALPVKPLVPTDLRFGQYVITHIPVRREFNRDGEVDIPIHFEVGRPVVEFPITGEN